MAVEVAAGHSAEDGHGPDDSGINFPASQRVQVHLRELFGAARAYGGGVIMDSVGAADDFAGHGSYVLRSFEADHDVGQVQRADADTDPEFSGTAMDTLDVRRGSRFG